MTPKKKSEPIVDWQVSDLNPVPNQIRTRRIRTPDGPQSIMEMWINGKWTVLDENVESNE